MTPTVGVGFNSMQGTVVRIGLEAGYFIDPQLSVGVAGYYAAGENPSHDREIGGGPFVAYAYPLADGFLTAHLREDLDYVDARIPINPPQYNDHRTDYGVASITSAGLMISFTRNFGISGGYRLAVGLTNSDIAEGRSGPYIGIAIGF